MGLHQAHLNIDGVVRVDGEQIVDKLWIFSVGSVRLVRRFSVPPLPAETTNLKGYIF